MEATVQMALWGLGGAGVGFLTAVVAFRTTIVVLERSVARQAKAITNLEHRMFVLLQIALDLAQRSGIDKRYSDELLRAYALTLSQEEASV